MNAPTVAHRTTPRRRRRPFGTLEIVLEYQRPALTDRGLAVVHCIRLEDAVRQLDATDREYLAPHIADILVDVCSDVVDRPKSA